MDWIHQLVESHIVTGDSSGKVITRHYFRLRQLKPLGVISITFPNTKSDEVFIDDDTPDLTQDVFYIEFTSLLLQNQKLAPLLPYVHHHDPKTKTIVVDDLGDEFINKLSHPTAEYYKLIDFLIELYNWTPQVSDKHLIKLRRLEKQALLAELDEFLDMFEQKQEQTKAILEPYLDKLMDQQMVICHRDYQSRNIMLKNGEPYIIDIQDMCLGPLCYDFVSLVYDSKINMSDEARQEYINYFQSQTGVSDEEIRAANIVRVVHTAGRHHSIYTRTGRKASLERRDLAFGIIVMLVPELA